MTSTETTPQLQVTARPEKHGLITLNTHQQDERLVLSQRKARVKRWNYQYSFIKQVYKDSIVNYYQHGVYYLRTMRMIEKKHFWTDLSILHDPPSNYDGYCRETRFLTHEYVDGTVRLDQYYRIDDNNNQIGPVFNVVQMGDFSSPNVYEYFHHLYSRVLIPSDLTQYEDQITRDQELEQCTKEGIEALNDAYDGITLFDDEFTTRIKKQLIRDNILQHYEYIKKPSELFYESTMSSGNLVGRGELKDNHMVIDYRCKRSKLHLFTVKIHWKNKPISTQYKVELFDISHENSLMEQFCFESALRAEPSTDVKEMYKLSFTPALKYLIETDLILQCGNTCSSSKKKITKSSPGNQQVDHVRTETTTDKNMTTTTTLNDDGRMKIAVETRHKKINMVNLAYKILMTEDEQMCLGIFRIPDNAKVVRPTHDINKYRCNQFEVLDMKIIKIDEVAKKLYYDDQLIAKASNFVYKGSKMWYYNQRGVVMMEDDFEKDAENACAKGFHFCPNIRGALEFHSLIFKNGYHEFDLDSLEIDLDDPKYMPEKRHEKPHP